jgi:hypothetical protein
LGHQKASLQLQKDGLIALLFNCVKVRFADLPKGRRRLDAYDLMRMCGEASLCQKRKQQQTL